MDPFLTAFGDHVARDPEHPAVIEGDRTVGYRELDAWSQGLSSLLRRPSADSQSRIGYLGPIDLEFVVTLLGAHRSGACLVWLDSSQPDPSLRELVEHARLDVVVHGAATLAGRARDLHASTLTASAGREVTAPLGSDAALGDDTDWGHIRYTSGSTGRPKGVPIGRAEITRILDRLHPTTRTTASDRVGLFGHFWPLTAFEALGHGATLVVLDPATQGPRGVLDEMCRSGVSVALTYTALFRQLADAATEQLESLRLAHLSGEQLRRSDIERFERVSVAGAELINSYGSSEYPLIAFHRHRRGDAVEDDPVPLGRPFVADEVDVIDEDGRSVEPGQVGRVVVRSSWLPAGYVDDPDRSSKVFVTDPHTGETVYHTGDLALRDDEGILHPRGRADDQVKIRGHTVRLSDVENVVAAHPAVRECAVVAVESPVGTRLVGRFVVEPGHELTGRELRRDLAVEVAGHLVPGRLSPIVALPVGENRKLDRARLLDEGGSGSALAVGDVVVNERIDTIRHIYGELLGHSSFTLDDDFFDVGGDSLLAMALVERVERLFSTRIPFDRLLRDGASVRAIDETLDRLSSGEGLAELEVVRGGTPHSPVLLSPLIDGGVSDYLALVRTIDADDAVLATAVPGLDGHTMPSRTIDELADRLESQVGDRRPRMIVGYSFGAVVAVELARRLGSSSSPRTPLVLIEPDVSAMKTLPRLRFVAHAVAERRFATAWTRVRLLLGSRRPASAVEVHTTALVGHTSRPLRPGRTLLVTAADSEHPASASSWRPLLPGECTHVEVGGDHLSVMRPPQVDEVARAVLDWLAADPSDGAT